MLVLVAALFFLLRWSFERGATTYMRQQDQEQLAQLAVDLADYYATAGSWQRFVERPKSWYVWLSAHQPGPGNWQEPPSVPPSEPPDHPSPPKEWFGAGPKPRHDVLRSHFKPVFLLDAQHQPLVGNYRKDSLLVPVEIERDGVREAVGYLGLPPPPSRMGGFWRAPLVAQQRVLLLYFTLGALLIAALAAIPLSARWSRRILQLHEYVKALAQGHYDNRVVVNGNDEIAGLGVHLNQLAQSLDDARRQRQQMTADISHELRTPVAGLQANIEAMQDEVLPLSQASLSQLHEQVRRLGSLINDLYQLSLADAGALKYRMAECDLRGLLEHLVSSYQPQFQLDRLSLDIQFKVAGDLWVWGDEERLVQVFTNLLENSRRYTQSPGEVRIQVDQREEMICVSLSDSAPGVDKSLHARLTDRLFRVDHSRNRASGGAGLGLNLCAAIVHAHNGELQFDDSELGGLQVIVKLPVMKG